MFGGEKNDKVNEISLTLCSNTEDVQRGHMDGQCWSTVVLVNCRPSLNVAFKSLVDSRARMDERAFGGKREGEDVKCINRKLGAGKQTCPELEADVRGSEGR